MMPGREEAREFLDVLERLVEAAEQRPRGEDREQDRDHRGDPADQHQLAFLTALA